MKRKSNISFQLNQQLTRVWQDLGFGQTQNLVLCLLIQFLIDTFGQTNPKPRQALGRCATLSSDRKPKKMREFLRLNKSKLLFAYKFCSILFLSLCCFFLILAKCYQNQFPETKLLILILIVAGIIFPVFILFITYLGWEKKNWIYTKYVKTEISKEQNSYGYSEKLTNENSKWSFTEKVLTKTQNGFEIQIEIVKNEIEFWVFGMNKEIEKTKLEYFEQKIQQLNIKKLFYGGFYFNINRKKLNENSLKEIEIKLTKFIDLLNEYNFKSTK